MRTFGSLAYEDGRWIMSCEPQVVIRAKRVFERVSKYEHDAISMSDTLENARELEWFVKRYSMVMTPAVRYRLKRRAAEHRVVERDVAKILSPGYKANKVNLAMPLRSYQNVAVELIERRKRVLIADELGLGKTAVFIGLLANPQALPALVVTMTHLPPQWVREISKFTPGLRVRVISKGTPYDLASVRGKPVDPPDVIVVSYSKIQGWADELGRKVRSVCLDEAQELRTGSGTGKHDGCSHIATHATYVVGLSATPIYNWGGEMWNVMQVIDPTLLGTEDEFLREWCGGTGPIDPQKGIGSKPVSDPKAFGMYLREQGAMLCRTRKDVGRELPPLQKVPHHIDADLHEIDKIASSAGELARIILQQGGPFVDKGRAARELDWQLRQATGVAKARYVAEFVRLIVEAGEPVVLFGWHREVYSLWSEYLADLKPAFYTGSETVVQKEEARRRFVEGETKILIMSLRSGAGLDGLQAVSRITVFGELDWSPKVHDQCSGRQHRDGMGTERVLAYYLIADSGSDPVIADVLQLKRANIDSVMDPVAALVTTVDPNAGEHAKRLAADFLARHQPKTQGRSRNASPFSVETEV